MWSRLAVPAHRLACTWRDGFVFGRTPGSAFNPSRYGNASVILTESGRCRELVVVSWSPAAIVAEVSDKKRYAISGGKAVLEVKVGDQIAVRDTGAEAMKIDEAQPKSLERKAGGQITLSGRGLMAYRVNATLGGTDLTIVSRADSQLVVALRADVDHPLGAVRLLLAVPEFAYEAAVEVTLTKPPDSAGR